MLVFVEIVNIYIYFFSLSKGQYNEIFTEFFEFECRKNSPQYHTVLRGPQKICLPRTFLTN